MPRPYSAEAAVQFYNRGVEGFGYIHLPTWSWRSTPKSERKSKKRAEETAVKTERAKKAWRPCMQQRKRKMMSIVETAKSVHGLNSELPQISERTKGTEESPDKQRVWL